MTSSLARHMGRSPTDAEQIETMRRAAWHRQGVVTLRPDEISDPWLKQAVINEANKRFGTRGDQR